MTVPLFRERSFFGGNMSGTHQYLTAQDVEKIKEELNERKVVTRHKLLDEVKEARAKEDY